MNVKVTFRVLGAEETDKQICLRAIVCKDVTIDLIIGLASILYYNLLPLLETHTRSRACCEICHEQNTTGIQLPVAHIYHDTDRLLLNANNHRDGPTPGLNAHHLTTERDFITEFRQQWAPQ
jgi:hypothetical protein